ncbi:MAG: SCO family protein [Candidatus Promineifilaceae bacterium]
MRGIIKLKVVVLIAALMILAACQTEHEYAGTLLSTPIPAPSIELESAEGPVSLQDFRGHYTYVYFGYTFCPDICPTTLATLKSVKEELGDDGSELEVVMISVDPERDTAEVLAQYMSYFDDSFVGLTGDKSLVDEVGAPFGLYYSKHEGSEATGYLVDHSAYVYLLDRDSNAVVVYPHGTTADGFAADLKYFLEQE